MLPVPDFESDIDPTATKADGNRAFRDYVKSEREKLGKIKGYKKKPFIVECKWKEEHAQSWCEIVRKFFKTTWHTYGKYSSLKSAEHAMEAGIKKWPTRDFRLKPE
jgi:hypothetical protein